MLQISTWRRYKTKVMHSIKPWGWEEWDPCNAVCTLVVAHTASPGPHITETAVLHKEDTSDFKLQSPARDDATYHRHFKNEKQKNKCKYKLQQK